MEPSALGLDLTVEGPLSSRQQSGQSFDTPNSAQRAASAAARAASHASTSSARALAPTFT